MIRRRAFRLPASTFVCFDESSSSPALRRRLRHKRAKLGLAKREAAPAVSFLGGQVCHRRRFFRSQKQPLKWVTHRKTQTGGASNYFSIEYPPPSIGGAERSRVVRGGFSLLLTKHCCRRQQTSAVCACARRQENTSANVARAQSRAEAALL